MSKFIPFTDDELYRAHHADIKAYLESIGETVLRSGTEYMWKNHDSVKFRGHVWYRFSTGDSGTAVTFLQQFFGFSYQDAVITLLDGKYIASVKTHPEDMDRMNLPVIKHKETKIILPPKNNNNKRLFAYLCKYRCVSGSVVNYFVYRQLIYEDRDNHNIVFLGKDKNGNVRYAGLKGTLPDKPYRRELNNSDKSYGFRHYGIDDTLFVFEAFIDLFSYIDLFLLNGDDWRKHSYLAMGGLVYQGVRKFIDSCNNIKKIIICTDNDNPGLRFADKAEKHLCVNYEVSIGTPNKKDWNDELRERKKIK